VQTLGTQFESELKKIIAAEIERLRDVLDGLASIQDFAAYRYHVGQIHALRRVSDAYCEEINTIISKR